MFLCYCRGGGIGLKNVFDECAEALQLVLAACKPKAKIVDICEKGDAFIREYVSVLLICSW